MIGTDLAEDQIGDFKRVIELLTVGSSDNFFIAYGPTAKDVYSEAKKEMDRFEPADAGCWN